MKNLSNDDYLREKFRRLDMIRETLDICEDGKYYSNGREVSLKYTKEQRENAKVILPEEALRITDEISGSEVEKTEYIIKCTNTDSYTMAREIFDDACFDSASDRILVLNFANSVHIGGGARRGALAQEEDLCRQSTLLVSLESENAAAYYNYNRGLYTFMGSDALIFSPYIEIIRDAQGDLLNDTVPVSVLTCAAPSVRHGLEGLDYEDYVELLRQRIKVMLACSANEGYTHLVLGAWGCGAFRNDAALISKLFYQEIERIKSVKTSFKFIGFPIMTREPEGYNYRCFKEYFS